MGAHQELQQAAVRLLSQREHSQAELRRKLAGRLDGDEGAELDAVLDDLVARGYQSDQRFAEQYCHSRQQRGFGPLRIRLELQERGIDAELIDQCLETSEQSWLEQMEQCRIRKFGARPPADYREQARQARFLTYRGFPPELVRQHLWRGDC